MSEAGAEDGWVQIRIPQERAEQAKRLARLIGREPFQKRSWAELGFFLASSALACAAVFVLGALGIAGLVLTVVFVGVVILAGGLRAARGFGRWQRALARRMLGEEISEPEPFSARPGFFGWLRASLGDRAAWRAVGYFVAKVPLTVFGVWFALSVWVEALFGIASPLTGGSGSARFGAFGRLLGPGYGGPAPGFAAHVGVFVTGVVLPVRRPVDDEAGRLPRPADDAPPARPRRGGVPGEEPRGVEVEDTRRGHRDPPAYRAQPPRRHPGPAGRPGHAARPGQGEARPPGRRRTDDRRSRRPSGAWSTKLTAAPRRRSPTCATWPGASTLRRSTPASKMPSPPWPHAARCPPR